MIKRNYGSLKNRQPDQINSLSGEALQILKEAIDHYDVTPGMYLSQDQLLYVMQALLGYGDSRTLDKRLVYLRGEGYLKESLKSTKDKRFRTKIYHILKIPGEERG
jgi:hypothetical protein